MTCKLKIFLLVCYILKEPLSDCNAFSFTPPMTISLKSLKAPVFNGPVYLL